MSEGLSVYQTRSAAYTFLFIYLASITFIGNAVERYESEPLLLAYGVGFFAYFWVVKFCEVPERALIILGVAVRVGLFFALPKLSDDFYRFIWDGVVIAKLGNPYGILPADALAQGVEGLSQPFFEQLNSPNYYTIYPPLNQVIFWVSALIGGYDSLLTSVNFMRVLLVIADIGSLLLLRRVLAMRADEKGRVINQKLAYWYFLNPLVVLEFTGNLHFEGFVIFFLLLGMRAFYQRKLVIQGLSFAGAIATKLVPLVFLPALLFRIGIRKGILVCLIAVVGGAITFLPLLGEAIYSGLTASIGLYFRSFEFNASVYFLLREIGYAVRGYNMIQTIGPWMAIGAFFLITGWAMYGGWKRKDIMTMLLFTLCIYLALTTTVHPWYILTLIPFGVAAGFYFPVVWSLMIFLTYMGYEKDGFELSMTWVWLEYLTVIGFLIVELIQKRKYGSL
ncbi:MAG: hypothetical protein AAGA85_08990 [Bacteroidota bacterium]